jgi:nucleoside 2-deoxyribosyltransferase
LKAYLAARYDRRDELRAIAEKLRKEVHFTITSRWLNETEPLNSDMGDHSDEFYTLTATIDLEDVNDADCVVFFSEDPLEAFKRGGRHVEFGFALAQNKPIYVIGPKENVFHYVNGSQVAHFHTVDQFIKMYTETMQQLVSVVRHQQGDEKAYIFKKKVGLEWLTEGDGKSEFETTSYN